MQMWNIKKIMKIIPLAPPLVKRGRGVYQVKVSFKGVKP